MEEQNIKNNSEFSVRIHEKLKSKNFRRVLVAVGSLILALVIFQVGMFVGYQKASFSYGWGDNYRQTFGGHDSFGMMRGLPPPDDFPSANGAIGKIIKINLPTFVVIGPDNVEKVVLVSNDTLIREFRSEIQATNLKVNDEVVAIGSPNSSSQIEAKLIRVLPAQPAQNSLPNSTTTQQ